MGLVRDILHRIILQQKVASEEIGWPDACTRLKSVDSVIQVTPLEKGMVRTVPSHEALELVGQHFKKSECYSCRLHHDAYQGKRGEKHYLDLTFFRTREQVREYGWGHEPSSFKHITLSYVLPLQSYASHSHDSG